MTCSSFKIEIYFILYYYKMDQVGNISTVDFNQLIHNNQLSLSSNTKLVNKINESFTEDQQRWFIANFYVYLNYHPTKDFPINLDNVYK